MMIQDIDKARINFDSDSLMFLNIALAVIMFVVALGIRKQDFKALAANPKLILLGVISQFILLPLLTYILVIIIKPLPSIAMGMFLVAACPGGNVSNFMSQLAHGNAALSVSLTAFATFAAMIMTPFNFQFYGGLYEPTAQLLKVITIDPWELIKVIFLILGFPLLFGMSIRAKWPVAADRLIKVLKPIAILVFVGIIANGFYNNLDIIKAFVNYVLGIGVLHNLLALALGFTVAVLFKLEARNKRTLALETGIQNVGLGLVLIFAFFEGLGGMAVLAAFWGILHLISGLILATIWSRHHPNRGSI